MPYLLAYTVVAFISFWLSMYGYHILNQKRRAEGQPEQDNIVGGSLLIALGWPLVLLILLTDSVYRLFVMLNTALQSAAVMATRGSATVHGVNPHQSSGLARCTQRIPPDARYCPRCGAHASRHITVRSFSP